MCHGNRELRTGPDLEETTKCLYAWEMLWTPHPSWETANWIGLDLPQEAKNTSGKPIPFLTQSSRGYIQSLLHLLSKLGMAKAPPLAMRPAGML